jgi:ribonuclease BN (tRNA processing enzyme)
LANDKSVYDPETYPQPNYLKFWGTRGSVPVAGFRHGRYGGDTACLEIRRHNEIVILDAGTGIRALGDELLTSQIREVHLFIGHHHWDHVIGFPFFQPLYQPDFVIHIYGPAFDGQGTQEALNLILEPHHFPVRLSELKAEVNFQEIPSGASFEIGDLHIHTLPCDHPGGALTFRLEMPHWKIGYTTDHEFLKGYRGHPKEIGPGHSLLAPYAEFLQFHQGIDLLVHEAQYTSRQYASRIGWGHTSIPNATALARLLDVEEWIVTHHDPGATDNQIRHRLTLHQQVFKDCDYECHVSMASDGDRFSL